MKRRKSWRTGPSAYQHAPLYGRGGMFVSRVKADGMARPSRFTVGGVAGRD
ncbi:MAG: hypothetical protein IIA55_06325 [Gemmatimonadetes bacterium]|nr:hypothetical protein [Gemmatimonadota bacterium]